MTQLEKVGVSFSSIKLHVGAWFTFRLCTMSSSTTDSDTRCLFGFNEEQKKGEDFLGHRADWKDKLGNCECEYCLALFYVWRYRVECVFKKTVKLHQRTDLIVSLLSHFNKSVSWFPFTASTNMSLAPNSMQMAELTYTFSGNERGYLNNLC